MQSLINLTRSVLDVIMAIPMPWRALVLILIGYSLLYAEFRVTNILRRTIGRPLPGTGLMNFALKWLIVVSFLASLWWGATRAWGFAESTVMASPAGPYITMVRTWWNTGWQTIFDLVRTWR